MIDLSHVSKTFQGANEVHAVNDVSLHINKGEIYGIVGFSGAGKSTLVRCINLLEKPTAGKVTVDGQELTSLKGRRLNQERKKIGMIFQQFNLFATRTVLDNVAFPLRYSGMSRKAIQEKYSNGGKFSDGGYGDMLTNMYTSIDALVSGTTEKTISSMEKIGAVAQATWAVAGAALQQYSAYSQACCDVEVAEVEKKYDKMIAAAGKTLLVQSNLRSKKRSRLPK